jgi:hypothetical protein
MLPPLQAAARALSGGIAAHAAGEAAMYQASGVAPAALPPLQHTAGTGASPRHGASASLCGREWCAADPATGPGFLETLSVGSFASSVAGSGIEDAPGALTGAAAAVAALAGDSHAAPAFLSSLGKSSVAVREPFACPYPACGIRFTAEAAARMHVLQAHREAPPLATTTEADTFFRRMWRSVGLASLVAAPARPGGATGGGK